MCILNDDVCHSYFHFAHIHALTVGMFASHLESGGDLVEIEGKLYKQFYGMSSAVAMNKHAGTYSTLICATKLCCVWMCLVHDRGLCNQAL